MLRDAADSCGAGACALPSALQRARQSALLLGRKVPLGVDARRACSGAHRDSSQHCPLGIMAVAGAASFLQGMACDEVDVPAPATPCPFSQSWKVWHQSCEPCWAGIMPSCTKVPHSATSWDYAQSCGVPLAWKLVELTPSVAATAASGRSRKLRYVICMHACASYSPFIQGPSRTRSACGAAHHKRCPACSRCACRAEPVRLG